MQPNAYEMINTILQLQYLNDDYCVFVGDSREQHTVNTMIGEQEVTNKYPAFQLSREMWESFGRPTIIRVSAEDISHVSTD